MIGDPLLNRSNESCFDDKSAWQYNGVLTSTGSALLILSDSLQSNRTNQFMVYMESKKNSSLQATGYVLVRVDDTHPQMVVIG